MGHIDCIMVNNLDMNTYTDCIMTWILKVEYNFYLKRTYVCSEVNYDFR